MKIPQFFNIRKAVNSGDALKLDLPMFSFIGMSLGFLVTGLVHAIIFGLLEAGEDSICSFSAVVGGLSSVAVSVGIAGMTGLYWWLVPRRHKILYPSLFWFGPLMTVLSFASGVLIGAELVVNVTGLLKS